MAKEKQTDEDKAAAKAAHVAKEIDAQAKQAEAEALKVSKDTVIAAGQTWEEAEHENPFEAIMSAVVDEVRFNGKENMYVKFVWGHKGAEPNKYEAVSEKEFRERFPKFIK
jgi:hypothetical protein